MNKKRPANQIRKTTIAPAKTAAPGSVIITQGNTRILCTASIADKTPPWIETDENGNPTHGWITAEYNMLPASTPERKKRGTDSRATEIKRLIGRALRGAVDMDKIPGIVITCDCDVLYADGGTRTASITGGFVALAQALKVAQSQALIKEDLNLKQIAAISVGIVESKPYLDLDYPLDSSADVDMNVVMNSDNEFIEIQGTGEKTTFNKPQLDELLVLAEKGTKQLFDLQREVIDG